MVYLKFLSFRWNAPWLTPERLFCSLCQFDMDGDGEITTEELRSAMTKLMGEHMSRREIDAIVKEADDNGDGTVDFEGTKRSPPTVA